MRNQWLFSAWHRVFVTAALLMALLIGMSAKVNALGASTLIALTNTQRSAAGVAPLRYNSALTSSAAAKARDMLAKGYWAHTSPSGVTAWTFVANAGYRYTAVGENLARDFGTDAAVISGWMASSGHRANMLNPVFRDVGIAVVSGTLAGQPTTIVVAHYGAPAGSTAPKPAPAPKPVAKPAPRPAAAKPAAQQPAAQPKAATPAPKPVTEPAPVKTVQPKPKSSFETLIENLVKIIEPSERELTSI